METSSGTIGSSIQASLSGRYATALFDLAADAKAIPAVEASLDTLATALGESSDLRAMLTSPLVKRGEATNGVAAVAKLLDLDSLTANFLGVLAHNRRLDQLEPVIRQFRQLAALNRGETTAEVISAHPLGDDQVETIKQQLRTRIGRDVTVSLSVDPSLLGGLVVKIGSQMIDSSIKTRLNALAHAMKG